MPDRQKWPSHLILVRHAESERNAAKRNPETADFGCGKPDYDVSITATGIEQAKWTSHRLHQYHADVIIASPYLRTLQTATGLSLALDKRVRIIEDARLREIEWGVMDGMKKQAWAERYPDEWERYQRVGKFYYRPPSGESWADVAERVHSFLGTLTRDYSGKTVCIVTHSVVIMLFRYLLERIPVPALMAIDADPKNEIYNCAVTRYVFDPDRGRSGKLMLKEFAGLHYPEEYAENDHAREVIEETRFASGESEEDENYQDDVRRVRELSEVIQPPKAHSTDYESRQFTADIISRAFDAALMKYKNGESIEEFATEALKSSHFRMFVQEVARDVKNLIKAQRSPDDAIAAYIRAAFLAGVEGADLVLCNGRRTN